jgi:hypothetical protein
MARELEHYKFLGSKKEIWDFEKARAESKFIDFSDKPFPKPWEAYNLEEVRRWRPICHQNEDGDKNCRDREIWLDLLSDFKARRR